MNSGFPYDSIIFDLDGTLVDAFGDIADSLNEGLARQNLPTHPEALVREWVGDGIMQLIERAAPGLSTSQYSRIHLEMMAYYRAHPVAKAVLYPGVLEALEWCRKAGLRLFVLSNKPHELTVAVCEGLKIDGYFAGVFGEGESGFPRKPDPTGVRTILREFDLKAALLIGDGVPDGKVARASGIDFAACLWGTKPLAVLREYQPIAVFERPEGMIMGLEGLKRE